MSNPRSGGGNDDGDAKDNAIAKTAGFLVFSGIALSILKALNPLRKPINIETQSANGSPQLSESIQSIQVQPARPLPPQQPIVKALWPGGNFWCLPRKTARNHNLPEVPESSQRTIEIVKGDTLWGLSRKFGVSINAIKEANGLEGDTIYAGKKLIIP
uniref:LysM domain-containing protein n=1 Tax=Fagus sylvatica TaxID=28930 RepID=A0A2N9F7T3_FAGSY